MQEQNVLIILVHSNTIRAHRLAHAHQYRHQLATETCKLEFDMLQVYGPESSGKTTLALHAMAAVQRSGGTALLVDAEHAFDAQYSKVFTSTNVPNGFILMGCDC